MAKLLPHTFELKLCSVKGGGPLFPPEVASGTMREQISIQPTLQTIEDNHML